MALSATILCASADAYSTTKIMTTTATARSRTSTFRNNASFLSMLKRPLPSFDDSEEPLLSSRQPHKLKNGRGTFLGFRNVKDLRSSSAALMPDGGLSPCVIRVLGVGGGGCNAVSCHVSHTYISSPDTTSSRMRMDGTKSTSHSHPARVHNTQTPSLSSLIQYKPLFSHIII